MEQKIGSRKRMCRTRRRREVFWSELFPHIAIISDPKRLAELNGEVERRKIGVSMTELSKGTL
jgi:hypothetical protein